MQARRVSWASHGLNGRVVPEPVELLVHLREDVLEHVLGVVGREPKRLDTDRVDVAREPFDERVPGRSVALAAARDELRIGQLAWLLLHRAILRTRQEPVPFEPRTRLVRLTIIGCSPAWPNPGGAQSGYLVEAGGSRLLLDCGPGVLSRLRVAEPWPRTRRDRPQPSAFRPLRRSRGPGCGGLLAGRDAGCRGPSCGCHPAAAASSTGSRRSTPFARAFTLREYDEDEPFTVAGFSLSARRVPHYDYTAFALRVERDGTVLAYSGDSAPSDALVDIARDADLFLCEATLAEPEPPEARSAT